MICNICCVLVYFLKFSILPWKLFDVICYNFLLHCSKLSCNEFCVEFWPKEIPRKDFETVPDRAVSATQLPNRSLDVVRSPSAAAAPQLSSQPSSICFFLLWLLTREQKHHRIDFHQIDSTNHVWQKKNNKTEKIDASDENQSIIKLLPFFSSSLSSIQDANNSISFWEWSLLSHLELQFHWNLS